jgi:hypothetical protein
MLFWTGTIAEQALVVNVRGFGLVLVSGCGHPPIERIIEVPIAAVVGGMHLPVQAIGTPPVRQAVLGTPDLAAADRRGRCPRGDRGDRAAGPAGSWPCRATTARP